MIDKILSFFNNIPADKIYHCLVGVILFAIGQLIGYGLLFAVVGAIGKEIYDYCHQDTHTPDVWDAVATTVGGLLAYVIYLGY